MVLGIPPGLSASDFDVLITPHTLRVVSDQGGVVHLAGELYAPVIPDDCVWDYDANILSIFLQKANLELFAAPASHSLTEWKALFVGGFKIKWDDSAKDYSDLPRHSMDLFKSNELEKETNRRIASKDEAMRVQSVEIDELRRRERQVRLAVWRGNEYADWVALNHLNPKRDPTMAGVAGGRDD